MLYSSILVSIVLLLVILSITIAVALEKSERMLAVHAFHVHQLSNRDNSFYLPFCDIGLVYVGNPDEIIIDCCPENFVLRNDGAGCCLSGFTYVSNFKESGVVLNFVNPGLLVRREERGIDRRGIRKIIF